MAAISDKAMNKLSSAYKFNGGDEMEESISLYSTFYRGYDQQLGRFMGVDMRSEESIGMSSYHFGANNPITFNDPLGDKYMDNNGNVWHHADPFADIPGLAGTPYSFGWGDDGFGNSYGGGGGGGGGRDSFTSDEKGVYLSGSYAQQILAAWQKQFNNPDEDGNWSFTFGRNKNGQVGYWGAFDPGEGQTYTDGRMQEVMVGTKFYSLTQGVDPHAVELAKYGQVISGGSTVFGGAVLAQGLLIEYGVVNTDKNWHQNYKTVYKIGTTASISLTGGVFFVVSKAGCNTTFSDWSGPVKGYTFSYGIFSGSYEFSKTYRTYGGGIGIGFTFPTRGTGAYISGITTLMGNPYYADPDAGVDPDVGHIVH